MKIKLVIAPILVFLFSIAAPAQVPTPTFERYAARVEPIKNIRVDLTSHRDARRFRTNLRNAAREGVNFGGRYVLTGWGCGTNCMYYAIIDGRTGKVFFPPQLSGASFGFCELPDNAEPTEFRADSRLLILSGFKGGHMNDENAKCGIYYFEWAGSRLRQVAFDAKRRSDAP